MKHLLKTIGKVILAIIATRLAFIVSVYIGAGLNYGIVAWIQVACDLPVIKWLLEEICNRRQGLTGFILLMVLAIYRYGAPAYISTALPSFFGTTWPYRLISLITLLYFLATSFILPFIGIGETTIEAFIQYLAEAIGAGAGFYNKKLEQTNIKPNIEESKANENTLV